MKKNDFEILLVEDNPNDAEMALHALKQNTAVIGIILTVSLGKKNKLKNH